MGVTIQITEDTSSRGPSTYRYRLCGYTDPLIYTGSDEEEEGLLGTKPGSFFSLRSCPVSMMVLWS